MTLKKKISWPNNIICKQVGKTSPWIIHKTYQKPKNPNPPQKTHPTSKTPQQLHFSPSRKKWCGFFMGQEHLKPNQLQWLQLPNVNQTSSVGHWCCWRLLLSLQAPHLTVLGVPPWRGTRWWVEFLSGHRTRCFRWYKNANQKNSSFQVGFFGMISFFVLDKTSIANACCKRCFSIKSKWSMEETWPP